MTAIELVVVTAFAAGVGAVCGGLTAFALDWPLYCGAIGGVAFGLSLEFTGFAVLITRVRDDTAASVEPELPREVGVVGADAPDEAVEHVVGGLRDRE